MNGRELQPLPLGNLLTLPYNPNMLPPLTGSGPADPHWQVLVRLIAASPEGHQLAAQGIGPLVAWRLRERDEPVPEVLAEISRRSTYGAVTTAPLLERVRADVAVSY